MKVVVINFTGSVGKTMVSSQILARNMPGVVLIAIESINETAEEGYGIDVEKMVGEKFMQFYRQVMLLDDAIVDVGASNVVSFLEGFVKFADAQKEFDAFLIPTTSGTKEQKETIAMIETLAGLGIEPSRIKVICNRVKEDVEEEFAALFAYADQTGKCILSPESAIYETELLDLLHMRKIGLEDLLKDSTDYRTLARSIGPGADTKQRDAYTAMHVMKALSTGVCRNFDTVFNCLFPERG
jgi:hypothetical protein